TISIDCSTILDNMDQLNPNLVDQIPEDGVILAETDVAFEQGETAFDVLRRVTQEQQIHLEFVSTPVYDSVYIEGIHNIYEFDCGALSGWMYKVNGSFPPYGSSQYE